MTRLTGIGVLVTRPEHQAAHLCQLIEAEGQAAALRREVTDRDFRFVAIALVGAAAAISHDWMIRDVRPPIEQLEEQLAALAVGLLTEG